MFLQEKTKRLVLLSAFVLVGTFAIWSFYNSYTTAQIKQAQTSPSNATRALLHALVINDEEMLMAIVIPEQHHKVEKHLATHKPFYCIPKLSYLALSPSNFVKNVRDMNFSGPIVSAKLHEYSDDMSIAYMSGLYSCLLDRSSFYGLNFQIYHLTVEKRGSRWYVQSWADFCEAESVAGCG